MDHFKLVSQYLGEARQANDQGAALLEDRLL